MISRGARHMGARKALQAPPPRHSIGARPRLQHHHSSSLCSPRHMMCLTVNTQTQPSSSLTTQQDMDQKKASKVRRHSHHLHPLQRTRNTTHDVEHLVCLHEDQSEHRNNQHHHLTQSRKQLTTHRRRESSAVRQQTFLGAHRNRPHTALSTQFLCVGGHKPRIHLPPATRRQTHTFSLTCDSLRPNHHPNTHPEAHPRSAG